MNDLFVMLGIEHWKPLLTSLVLPPLPLLLLVLVGARLLTRRRLLGWSLVLLGVAGVWLSTTHAMAYALGHTLLKMPPPLAPERIVHLKGARDTTILVLGGGRKPRAPEYGVSDLHPRTLERLRYGVWLARETGLPLAFSGGVGHGAPDGPSEADIAARVADKDWGVKLAWTEGESRDTNENAMHSLPLLRQHGVKTLVLVTQDFHMPRAVAGFERAMRRAGDYSMEIVPAPMGQPTERRLHPGDFLPSIEGYERTTLILHEWLGWVAGA